MLPSIPLHRHHLKSKKAFTLVELSIVIVIIGLIIAAVTAGKSLVKSSRMKGLINEVSQYKQAVLSFKLQYSMLPGDFKNASSFWPGVTNGNGNRKVLPYAALNYVSPSEEYLAMKHLTLANLAPKPVTNLGAAPQTVGVLGEDVPSSSNYDAVFYIESDTYLWSGTTLRTASEYRYIPGHENTMLVVGKYSGKYINGAGFFPVVYPFVSLVETIALDNKIDDGLRLKGDLQAASAYALYQNDANNPFPGSVCGSNTVSEYPAIASNKGCVLFFNLQVK